MSPPALLDTCPERSALSSSDLQDQLEPEGEQKEEAQLFDATVIRSMEHSHSLTLISLHEPSEDSVTVATALGASDIVDQPQIPILPAELLAKGYYK